MFTFAILPLCHTFQVDSYEIGVMLTIDENEYANFELYYSYGFTHCLVVNGSSEISLTVLHTSRSTRRIEELSAPSL